MDCPKCLGKLSKVEIKFHEGFNDIKQARVTTLEVDQCFVCNGIWFDRGELEKYINNKLTVLDSPMIDFDLLEDMDKKVVRCSRCNVDMVKKSAPISKDITVDFCEKCAGVWLDSTEIDRIEERNVGFREKVSLFIKSLTGRSNK